MKNKRNRRDNAEGSQELQTLTSGKEEKQSLVSAKELQEFPDNDRSPKDAKWRKAALCVSYVSIVVTSSFGITFYVFSEIAGSPAAFGFAFAAILDTFSSVVVVWRFFGEAGRQFSFERERRACLAIAVCFILSSFAIAGKAIYTLIMQETPGKESLMEILTSASFVVLFGLTCLKCYIAGQVDSRAMRTDALNSLAGAVMTLGMVLSDVVCQRKPTVCFLDSVTALLIAIALFIYGVKTIVELTPRKGTEPDPTD